MVFMVSNKNGFKLRSRMWLRSLQFNSVKIWTKMAEILWCGSWFGHNPAVHMIENRAAMLRGYYNSNIATTTTSLRAAIGDADCNLKLCTGLMTFCKVFQPIAFE